MIRDVPTRWLLLIAFLAAGLLPLMIVALVGYGAGRAELKQQAFRQLESVRNIKRAQLGRFFDERRRDAVVLAHDPYMLDAYAEIDCVFRGEGGAQGGRFVGRDRRQFDAPEAYQAVHDRFYPFFSRYVAQLGYYDLLLINASTGEVVFSVEKERDFASVVAGQPTSLRDVWIEAVAGKEDVLSDTRPYPPSANAAAQFVAAPLKRDGRIVGVLALQIAIAEVDAIAGERSGMGTTGDTWLVGSDFRPRSDSARDSRISVPGAFASPAPHLLVNEASQRALRGEIGSGVIADQEGHRVLAAWSPFEGVSPPWALVAQIDESEIDAQIDRALNTKVTVLLLASGVAVVLLALLLSMLIGRSVGSVGTQLGRLSDAVMRGELKMRADESEVSVDFRGVVHRINDLVDAFVAREREKHLLEERIARMQRLEAVGTLAGGIAHDFNNILTYMFAYADIVQRQLPVDSPASPHVEQLVGAIERASGLVGQILSFSRQLQADPLPLDLGPLVKEVVKLVRGSLPPGKQVHVDIPGRSFTVLANPSQMHQVVLNLLTNARQAVGTCGGRIAVALSDERVEAGDPRFVSLAAGEYRVLHVTDDGCGMDRRTQERVFEPFFTTKPVGQGTGMGLALVHGIVTGCGGAILVDSQLGKGSSFRVFLPRCEEKPRTDAAPDRDTPGAGRRILLVDDERHVCEASRLVLESLGFSVKAFTSSEDAMAELRSHGSEYHAVVTDLRMPHVNGLEVAEAARKSCPGVLVILATAYSDVVTADTAREAGVSELLFKPFRRSDLARVLRLAGAPPPASGA